MADLRCQMCGKANPDSLDECQYCGARLKPLIAPSPAGAEPPPSEADPGGDWLRSLRTGAAAEEEEPLDEAEFNLPEWLNPAEETSPAADEESGLPAWFDSSPGVDQPGHPPAANLEPEPEPAFSAPEAANPALEEDTGPDADLPAWMRAELKREQKPPAETAAPVEELDDSAAMTEVPDWLARLGESAEPAPPAAESPAEPAYPAEPEADTGEIPAWLRTIGEAADAVQNPQESAETPPSTEGLPEWAGLGDEPAAEIETVEDMPEWLLGSTPPERKAPTPEELAAAGEEARPQDTPPAPPWPAVPEEDLPAWLTNLGQEAVQAEPSTPAAGEEIPEWMRAPDSSEVAKLHDWLGEETPADENTPDWLSALRSSEAQALAQEAAPAAPAEPPPAIPSEDIPEWLHELQAQSPSIPVETVRGQTIGGSSPPESASSPAFFTGSGEDSGINMLEALGGEELPDWMSIAREMAEEVQADENASLPAGELPEWLQAMRPVEEKAAPAAEQTSGELEAAGPLAGLRALLPAEAEVTRVGKPPVYVNRLAISEAQQAHVELLHSLIASEATPQPLPKKTILTPQTLFRTVVFLALLLAAFLPVISGTMLAPLPLPAPEVRQANAYIERLEVQAPVLLVFDYEPGFSGEMDAAAAALVDHLMLKGARLAVVSTSPVGPALAERFINQVESQHNYQAGVQYTNLGYIAGGAMGLLNFSVAPQSTVSLPFDTRYLWDLFDPQANNGWNSAPLAGVARLADFRLTVVLTEDPATARAWMEQVGPALRRESLLMVVSAQAEPLVRPYYGQQLAGLVTGLAGGAEYEGLQGRSNLARSYWDAYSLSLLAAELLILGFGAYHGGKALLNLRAARGGRKK